MKISGTELVRRFHVVFSKAESDALRTIGHLPSWSSPEAPLTLTEQELLDTFALIGVHAGSDGHRILLRQIADATGVSS